jgi:hypothetical protein
VRATAIGIACFRSDVTVPVGPADASESGIRVKENYVAREN